MACTRGARARRWSLLAVLLACEEFEDSPEPTCDDRFGTFFFRGFAPTLGEFGFESCQPCIVRGSRVEIMFLPKPVVKADVHVIAASPDYFTELGDGLLRAEKTGLASVMAWAEDRVVSIATLSIHDFDDLALFYGDTELSSLALDVDAELEAQVQPVFDQMFECETVGVLDLAAASSDPAVFTVTTDGSFLRVHAVGRGEATLSIEVAGFTRELDVLVDVPQHDTAAEGSSSG
jgi:hypothetical protein